MRRGRQRSYYSFFCLNCQAYHQIIKVERGPETVDRDVTCRSCGAPLPGSEGRFLQFSAPIMHEVRRHPARSRPSIH
jgi:hypothetical protein